MGNGSFSRHGQILIASLTLSAAAMIGATGWYYLRQRAAIEAAVTQELSAIAEIKIKQIVNWRRERLGDGRVFQSSASMRVARRALAARVIEPADRADLLDVTEKLEREFLYAGAALVDRTGAIRLLSGSSPSDSSRISELGQAGSRSEDVSLTDLYWDAKLGRPLMALSIPVQHAGALILTIDPDRFLYPFIRTWPVPSATGETVLVRREGPRVLYLTDLRHKPGSGFHFWRPVLVKRSAIEAKFGWVFKETDYRGVPVLGTIRPIPDSPWHLIAKIDASEVDAPVSRLGWEMALIVALIAVTNAAGAAFIWRDRQMRIYSDREKWLRQVANETPAYLWMTGADGRNSFINKPLAEFLGTEEERLGGNWKTFFHPHDADRVFDKFFDSVITRSEFADEHRLRRFDGEYRWFVGKGRPRFSHQGEFLGYAGSLLDVTDRRIAEQRARESAELMLGQNRVLELILKNAPLQATLDSLVRVIEALAPDMLASILLLDDSGLHLRTGAAPSLPEGYSRAIDGKPIGPAAGSCGTAAFRREPVIVEDIATDPLWKDYRAVALQHGLRACWSTPIFEEKDGDEKRLLGTFALYFRSPGSPAARHRELIGLATQTAAIAIVKSREKEALRKSEEEIKRREAQLIEAQRLAHVGSYEWDIRANKVYRSEELCNILGLSSDEFGRTFEGYLERVHPEDRDSVIETIEQARREGKTFDHEIRIVRPDGSVRVLRSQGRFICDNVGLARKLVGTCQDVTERKRAESQLHDANAALTQELRERARTEKEIQALSARLINAQEEERTRLARELHDDLSQQIAALSIGLSNLKREIPASFADARAQSERIREKLVQLAASTRRISHQLHPAVLEHCGLDVALRAFCSEYSALAGIRVSFTSGGSPGRIPANVALCAYRVTQEALQNVVKHAKTGEADITVTYSRDSVLLRISDSGIGIDPNGINVGLGLTSIRERTRLVNGTVNIHSEQNHGTRITVTLPIAASDGSVLFQGGEEHGAFAGS